MNQSLSRIHLGFAIFYAVVAAVLCVLHLTDSKASLLGVVILLAIFGTPFVLHTIALAGVRSGRLWGRNLSRVLGILLLFAAPIGTILGGFILLRTSKKDWQTTFVG